MCIIRFDCLIALYRFISLVHNASFIIKKLWCQVRTQWCQQITLQEHLVGYFALVHLTFGLCTSPTDTFPFTYHSFNGPGMCIVDHFQRLIFDNSRSPDKFTGKRKTRIIFLRLRLHCVPSTRSMAHPDISKCVHLPPITKQSSPHCYTTRRTSFRNWRT